MDDTELEQQWTEDSLGMSARHPYVTNIVYISLLRSCEG